MKESPSFLKLYVDPAWKRGDVWSPLMYPFWGNPLTEAHLFAKELYDSFSYDTRLYGITEKIEEADMVFAPYRQAWMRRHAPALLEECVRVARQAKLPLLIDGVADGEHPLHLPNVYVLRIGGYRFLEQGMSEWGLPPHIGWEQNRVMIPTQADDLLARCRSGVFKPRSKGEDKPIVGFSGMVRTTLKNMVHERLNERSLYARSLFDRRYLAMSTGIFWRQKALRALQRSSHVMTSFKPRDFYSGSTGNARMGLRELQGEFVENVLSSDYALDVRGYANASVRLYEILSLGRIPLILDTERNFPFSDEVDYRRFSLIVDFRDIRRLPSIVADFHASLSPKQFEEMQKAAREAFVKHFRVDAQMPHIIRSLNALGAFEKLR